MTLNRGSVLVSALLSEAIASLPPIPDREIPIVVDVIDDAARVQGDPVRLRSALASVLGALRREVVSSDRLVVRVRPQSSDSGRRAVRIAVADADQIEMVEAADGSAAGGAAEVSVTRGRPYDTPPMPRRPDPRTTLFAGTCTVPPS